MSSWRMEGVYKRYGTKSQMLSLTHWWRIWICWRLSSGYITLTLHLHSSIGAQKKELDCAFGCGKLLRTRIYVDWEKKTMPFINRIQLLSRTRLKEGRKRKELSHLATRTEELRSSSSPFEVLKRRRQYISDTLKLLVKDAAASSLFPKCKWTRGIR